MKYDYNGRYPLLKKFEEDEEFYFFNVSPGFDFNIIKVKATNSGKSGYLSYEPIKKIFQFGDWSNTGTGISWASAFFKSTDDVTQRVIIHIFENK